MDGAVSKAATRGRIQTQVSLSSYTLILNPQLTAFVTEVEIQILA